MAAAEQGGTAAGGFQEFNTRGEEQLQYEAAYREKMKASGVAGGGC